MAPDAATVSLNNVIFLVGSRVDMYVWRATIFAAGDRYRTEQGGQVKVAVGGIGYEVRSLLEAICLVLAP